MCGVCGRRPQPMVTRIGDVHESLPGGIARPRGSAACATTSGAREAGPPSASQPEAMCQRSSSSTRSLHRAPPQGVVGQVVAYAVFGVEDVPRHSGRGRLPRPVPRGPPRAPACGGPHSNSSSPQSDWPGPLRAARRVCSGTRVWRRSGRTSSQGGLSRAAEEDPGHQLSWEAKVASWPFATRDVLGEASQPRKPARRFMRFGDAHRDLRPAAVS